MLDWTVESSRSPSSALKMLRAVDIPTLARRPSAWKSVTLYSCAGQLLSSATLACQPASACLLLSRPWLGPDQTMTQVLLAELTISHILWR